MLFHRATYMIIDIDGSEYRGRWWPLTEVVKIFAEMTRAFSRATWNMYICIMYSICRCQQSIQELNVPTLDIPKQHTTKRSNRSSCINCWKSSYRLCRLHSVLFRIRLQPRIPQYDKHIFDATPWNLKATTGIHLSFYYMSFCPIWTCTCRMCICVSNLW